jgi:hypothetical protein
LNGTAGWRKILGLLRPDRNQKDVELILRLFALFQVWEQYEKPMLRYLNKKMDQERDFSSDRAIMFEKRFPEVVQLVNSALTKPFRPRGVINSAVLESVMVTLLENDAVTADQLKERYSTLLGNKEFMDATTGGTTDTLVLRNRLALAHKILGHGQG